MTDQSSDTKHKILGVARVLFAHQGFAGTSIRSIASAAEVNVASVNYHFSSKENLFAEILRAGYNQCAETIRGAYEERNLSVEETLIVLFQYFMDQEHDLISYFKMMMSEAHCHKAEDDEMIGPPGGKTIMAAITKEVGAVVGEEDLYWALKCLFSHVVHQSIMYHCCFKNDPMPYSSKEDIEKSIRRLSKLILHDLKSPKK